MAIGVSQIKIELARFKQEEAQVQREAHKGLSRAENLSNELEKPARKAEKPSINEEALLELKEERLLQKLRQVDREVRAHEQAHLMAAGPYARGAPHYEYVRGPDGRLYAVAGEVKIDTSPVPGDPEATLEKARAIKRAALAPANPSPQDRRVAALADRMAAKALMEIQKKHMEALKATMETEATKIADVRRKEALSSYQKIAKTPFPPTISLDRKA